GRVLQQRAGRERRGARRGMAGTRRWTAHCRAGRLARAAERAADVRASLASPAHLDAAARHQVAVVAVPGIHEALSRIHAPLLREEAAQPRVADLHLLA